MPEQGTRPTIHTVAERAGVSIASVSRVLNGAPSRQATEERVRRAAEEVGYRANALARSLQSRKSGHVSFVVEDIGNPAYLAMVRAIEPVFREAGIRLLLHSTGGDVSDELGVLDSLNEHYVDGMILCPIRVSDAHLKALQDTAVPVVVIGSLPDNAPVDHVRAESPEGVAVALQHLYDQGSRRIGFINGPEDTVPGSARLRGYLEGLERLGLPVDESLIDSADSFTFDAGTVAAERLLENTVVDAVLGANDRLALGVVHAARAAGLTVPEDLRVVGMDDTELARSAMPPLTSVNLGAAERGRMAAELLLERLNGVDSTPRSQTVSSSLTVRDSSQ